MSEYKPNILERISTWVLRERPAINETVSVEERKIQALRGKGLREYSFNPFSNQKGYSNKLQRSKTASWFQWYDCDSTVRSGVNSLVETSTGLGYHTIMPASYPVTKDKLDEPITPKEKELIDEFGRVQNLDHLMPNITRLMLIAGFCAVETRITKFPAKSKLKIIHPVTVEEIHVDEDGKFDYLIQRIDTNTTEKFTKDEVTLFVYNQMGNDYRGRGLIETVTNELSIKHAALNNMEGMIERYISPLYIWKSTGDITPIKNAIEHRDSGEDIFLGNMELNEYDQFDAQPIEVKGDSKFSEFITFVDQLIWIGINSANQMYWRNATEASATVLEDLIDRNINAIQRNVARGVETGFFNRILTANGYKPELENITPRVAWGMPRTGTEDLRPEEVIMRGLDLFYIREAGFYQLLDQMGFKIKPPSQLEDPDEDDDTTPDDSSKGDSPTVEPEEEPSDDSDADEDT